MLKEVANSLWSFFRPQLDVYLPKRCVDYHLHTTGVVMTDDNTSGRVSHVTPRASQPTTNDHLITCRNQQKATKSAPCRGWEAQ